MILWLLASVLFLGTRTQGSPDLIEDSAAVQRRTNVSECKLPATNNVYLSEGFGYQLNCAPSTGSLNGFMLFVDFPDRPAPATETPQSLRDVFLPQAAEWYANASYGRLHLNVTADTTRFYRMPVRSDSYNWQRGLTSSAHLKYIQDALDAYARGGGTIAQAVLPTDVLYIVPTTKAPAISFSVTYMSDVRTRSSSARMGTFVARKATTFGVDVFSTWKFKALNHETGHTMCLPDLYPLPSGDTGLYVGGWDIMGYINGPDPDYFAWHKWKLGWLDDGQIDCISGSSRSNTTHKLSPIEVDSSSPSDVVQAVVVRRNATTVLVAEARSRQGGDAAACATGVLLYTVSTAAETGKGSVRVLDANPRSGGCAGDELNDAPLNLAKTSSYVVAGWGVRITVIGQDGDSYTIRVEVS
ncbi:hypothetical protein VTK73DRAFT_1402 [Phialemonium thermophilum]|uniref:M6 family metalloprotease domain-containing protein n=1 Tax=Phialemonium thermophilum TaxID=223376 RepID=A0ABR3X9L5_9PEZI